MAHFTAADGTEQQVALDLSHLQRAQAANLSLPQFINREYGAPHAALGTPWRQMCTSLGFLDPGARDSYGFKSPTLDAVLNGSAGFQAAGQGSGTTPNSTIWGGAESRLVFASVVIEMAEARLYKDLGEDPAIFNSMIALDMSLASPNFEQPIIDYETPGGAQGAARARPQRIAQFAEPAALLRFGTSGKVRKIPTQAIGMEFSMEALKATTLDLVGMTLARHMMVEENARVYEFLADLWTGDADINIGAIAGVTSTSLDAAATGGVLTWKAWIKWLRRNKTRKITHVIGDIDTWIKVLTATGRPGASQAQDTRVQMPDAQAIIMNPYFGENVQFYEVDSAANGGPVPANTLWGLDARSGIVRVRNTDADYRATEQFAMRKTEALRIDSSLLMYRQFDECFDVLTIA